MSISLASDVESCPADELLSHLVAADSLAIVCHNNPDPDCLSSALALETVARYAGIETVDTFYGGTITHQQNRAMVNLLEMSLEPFTATAIEESELVAFVDHARPGANNDLSTAHTPDIVIDHHPHEDVVGTYVDHRVDVGATASILTEYLSHLDLNVTERLATALLFGIRRETLEFTRSVTAAEYTSAQFLHPNANMDLLRELSESLFAHETLDSISDAIRNRTIRGSCLVSHAGRTPERDTLPQAADYLLNLEGVNTTIVFGVIDDTVQLSARSRDPRLHLGNRMHEAFDEFGSAGGHRNMAGGSIPLGIFGPLTDCDDQLLPLVTETITNRAFAAIDTSL